MSTRKTTAEKIEAAKLEKQQAANRIKKLLQTQKAEERKARNHRLCQRGGKLEKLLPGLARLTEEQFESFVDKCLLTKHTRGILAELAPPEPEQANDGANVAQGGADAATQPPETAARTESAPAPKPTIAAHNPNNNNKTETAQAPRVAS